MLTYLLFTLLPTSTTSVGHYLAPACGLCMRLCERHCAHDRRGICCVWPLDATTSQFIGMACRRMRKPIDFARVQLPARHKSHPTSKTLQLNTMSTPFFRRVHEMIDFAARCRASGADHNAHLRDFTSEVSKDPYPCAAGCARR